MPKFNVQRSIDIHASPQVVYDRVADFGTWTKWSPWLCCEPQAKVDVSENPSTVGSMYSWDGSVVGAGEIEHKALEPGKHIQDEIRFLKPMRSVSEVAFDFQPVASENGESSRVTWHMRGSLPWFLFWMTSKIESFISMDYDRGLKMLKEWIETDHIRSNTQVHGVQKMGPFQVVGYRSSSSLSDIGPAMDQAFSKAVELMSAQGLPTDGEKISVYHNLDTKTQSLDFTAGFLFATPVDSVPAGLSDWSIPEMDCFRVDHHGSYEHLGNAWSAAMQHVRYKKMKASKIGNFELYKNDPAHTPPEHLLTEVYIPLSS